MNANVGDRIGDYEVVGILGAGGMGRVYKVRNVISDRVEAIKVLLPDLASVPELADRFMREIKVLAGLEHPNIAALRTAQRIDNQLVMVMELVEGVTIEERLKGGPLPVEQALDAAAQVLAALGYAHERGIIHRDIKPANMMVSSGGVLKLMDFGIARAAGDRKLTATGTTLGSLYYMSPEQIKGEELDARSDLYSFGVSLYEMVTGARPFRGDSDFSVMSAHLEKQPVPPIEVDSRLPAALNEIILMSIAKEPAKRFQSAKAFAGALASLSGRASVPPPRPQPAAAAVASPVAAQAASLTAAHVAAPPGSANRRGLYIALGTVLALVVIVAGAITIPKLMRTTAGETPAGAPQDMTAVAEEPVQTEAQPPTGVGLPPDAALPDSQAPSQGGISQQKPAQGSTGTGTRFNAEQGAIARPGSVQATQPPAQRTQSPGQYEARQQAASQAAQAGAAEAAKTAALREVQKSWPGISSRAGAVSSTLQNLQREQQRSGFGLRGDISASWKRMEHYMDQVDAAIAARDPDAAKENMEDAERELQTLEKFLGR
jgi:serine/threonine-protein kinase